MLIVPLLRDQAAWLLRDRVNLFRQDEKGFKSFKSEIFNAREPKNRGDTIVGFGNSLADEALNGFDHDGTLGDKLCNKLRFRNIGLGTVRLLHALRIPPGPFFLKEYSTNNLPAEPSC